MPYLPIQARYALKRLGADIRTARRRRRIPTALMAERALISRVTLGKIENGDPSVSLGRYATVLTILGMIRQLGRLADPANDSVGQSLEEDQLPKRIHMPKRSESSET